MTGKLKTRGNMMLATKLDAVLKVGLLCSCDLRIPNVFSAGRQSKVVALEVVFL